MLVADRPVDDTGEVGEGASDAADAVVPAGGQPTALELGAEQVGGRRRQRRELVELLIVELAVEAAGSLDGDAAGTPDPRRDLGGRLAGDAVEQLSDVGKLEAPPRQNGRRLTMLIAPDKAKIEAIKRREAPPEEEKENSKDDAAAGAAGEPQKVAEDTPVTSPPD